jgi:hypothetical protein
MSEEIINLAKARLKTSGKKIFVTQTPNEIDCGEFSKLHAGFDISQEPHTWVVMLQSLGVPRGCLCIDGSNVEAAQSMRRKFVESKVI